VAIVAAELRFRTGEMVLGSTITTVAITYFNVRAASWTMSLAACSAGNHGRIDSEEAPSEVSWLTRKLFLDVLAFCPREAELDDFGNRCSDASGKGFRQSVRLAC
jgi:hypothetical protein